MFHFSVAVKETMHAWDYLQLSSQKFHCAYYQSLIFGLHILWFPSELCSCFPLEFSCYEHLHMNWHLYGLLACLCVLALSLLKEHLRGEFIGCDCMATSYVFLSLWIWLFYVLRSYISACDHCPSIYMVV